MSVDDATISRIAVEIAKAQARSDTPRYRQIIDVLLATIEHGLLAPGDRLPPETKLASLFSVSLGTAQKALTYLANNGILQRVRRKGTIVAGRQAEDVFVFRFKEVGTGKVLIPFTRVLSIVADNSDGPWRRFLSGERHVRVDRLVWVEGEAPAFSQVRIGLEHGRSLLKMPDREPTRALISQGPWQGIQPSDRANKPPTPVRAFEPAGVPPFGRTRRHVRDGLGCRRVLASAGDDLSVAPDAVRAQADRA